jgi:hypothetical protein
MEDFPEEIYTVLYAREKNLRFTIINHLRRHKKDAEYKVLNRQHKESLVKLNDFKSKYCEFFI